MGNQVGKKNPTLPCTSEELKVFEAAYRASLHESDHPKHLTQGKLQTLWGTFIDPHLAECTARFLFISPQSQTPLQVDFARFTEPYNIVHNGTIDDQYYFILNSLGASCSDQLFLRHLETYIGAVLKTYLSYQLEEQTSAFESWQRHGSQSPERTILGYAKGILRELSEEKGLPNLSLNRVDGWLREHPTFVMMWKEAFTYLYNKNANLYVKGANKAQRLICTSTIQILPLATGIPLNTNYASILDIPHVIFLNSNLPNDMRPEWRLLFSSKIMGESFSTMIGKITNQGPTLIVIEDEDCYLFAGYASESWSLGPTFRGDSSSMLLTLSPAMRCFNSSGFNDHYQYLNLHQHTMPNGLGMGGQFGYWGLWLDREYGYGHTSESCTTYRDYRQLSKRKEFIVRSLEVWAFILPETEEGVDQRRVGSVLDDAAEKAYLELTGKKMHSDGLRE